MTLINKFRIESISDLIEGILMNFISAFKAVLVRLANVLFRYFSTLVVKKQCLKGRAYITVLLTLCVNDTVQTPNHGSKIQ